MLQRYLEKNKKAFFRFFPPPQFLLMPTHGLNISDHSVKVLELVHGPEMRLGRFGEEPISDGAIKSGNINDREELKKTLKIIKDKYNVSLVKVSLPEEKAYVFKLKTPKSLDERQIRDNIEFHLEENVPISVQEAVFDYQIIPNTSTSETIEVVVSVLPQKVVASYMNLLLEVGIKPISFEIEAESIARALIKEGDMGTYMIVDYGRTRTSFSIVSSGAIRYTSTADIGGDIIDEIIEKQTGVSGEKARILKNEKGLVADKEFPELYISLANTVSILKDEINKRFIFWHTHLDGGSETKEKIKKVFLVGGNSNLFGLEDYLSTSLKIGVERANVWANVDFADDFVPPINFNDSLSYASVIGLSLADSV